MTKLLTYSPMAKTQEGQTLFLYDSVLSMNEAINAVKIWEESYGYHITEAWIDVFDGGLKPIKTIHLDKVWIARGDFHT